MRETIRLTPSPFRTSGPTVEYDIITVVCECREWPIVVASSTWDPSSEAWDRQYYHTRNCGYCGTKPWRTIDEST